MSFSVKGNVAHISDNRLYRPTLEATSEKISSLPCVFAFLKYENPEFFVPAICSQPLSSTQKTAIKSYRMTAVFKIMN